MKTFSILLITILISSCSLIKDENISKIDLSKKEIEEDISKEIEKDLKKEILDGELVKYNVYTNTGIIYTNRNHLDDYIYNNITYRFNQYIELGYNNVSKVILLEDNKNIKKLENLLSLGNYNIIDLSGFKNNNYIENIGEKIPKNFDKLKTILGNRELLDKLFISLLDKNINDLSIDMICGGNTKPVFSKKITDRILKRNTKFELELMCGAYYSFEDSNFLEKAKKMDNVKIILK